MEDNAAKRNRQIKQEKQVKAGRRVSRKCQEQRHAILYNIHSLQTRKIYRDIHNILINSQL